MLSNSIIDFLSGLPVIGWIIERLRERSSKLFLTTILSALAAFGVIGPEVPGQVSEIVEVGQELVDETGAAIDSTQGGVEVIIEDGKTIIDDAQRRGLTFWQKLGIWGSLVSGLFGFGAKDARNGEEYEMVIREMEKDIQHLQAQAR